MIANPSWDSLSLYGRFGNTASVKRLWTLSILFTSTLKYGFQISDENSKVGRTKTQNALHSMFGFRVVKIDIHKFITHTATEIMHSFTICFTLYFLRVGPEQDVIRWEMRLCVVFYVKKRHWLTEQQSEDCIGSGMYQEWEANGCQQKHYTAAISMGKETKEDNRRNGCVAIAWTVICK